jgi:hypothetical protein
MRRDVVNITRNKKKHKKNKGMKRKTDIDKDVSSSDEENIPTKVPFWKTNCTKLSKRLSFGIRGATIKTKQKEWDPF